MSLAGISIRRPVATTMVMVSFIFIGLLAMFSMKKGIHPEYNKVVFMDTTSGYKFICGSSKTSIEEMAVNKSLFSSKIEI